MAGLRKLRGKFYARIQVKGKEKLLPLKTCNKLDAEKRLRLINEREFLVKAGLEKDVIIKELPTLNEAVTLFMNGAVNKGLSHNTINAYSNALLQLRIVVGGNVRVDSLSKLNCEQYVAYCIKNYARASVNSMIKVVNTFFNWLRSNYNDIEFSPRIKEIKVEKKLPEFLLPEELDKIYLQCDDPKMLATFRVYEYTGIRLRELHNCILDNSTNGKYIKLVNTKGMRERIIPIPPEIVDDFKIAKYGPYSFNPEIKEPYKPNYISKAFSKLRTEAGITSNKTIHSLRHTFALRKLLELGNIYLVMQMLGHANVKTTQIYLEFPKDYLKEVFDKWIPEIQKRIDSNSLQTHLIPEKPIITN